jgi:hypothetical protein
MLQQSKLRMSTNNLLIGQIAATGVQIGAYLEPLHFTLLPKVDQKFKRRAKALIRPELQ